MKWPWKMVLGKPKVGYVPKSYTSMKKLIKWKCNSCGFNYACVEDVGCAVCTSFHVQGEMITV